MTTFEYIGAYVLFGILFGAATVVVLDDTLQSMAATVFWPITVLAFMVRLITNIPTVFLKIAGLER